MRTEYNTFGEKKVMGLLQRNLTFLLRRFTDKKKKTLKKQYETQMLRFYQADYTFSKN